MVSSCSKYLLRCNQTISSVAQSCLTRCNPMDCKTPGLLVHHQILELAQTHAIELVIPSNHFILCHPILLLPSIIPNIRVFPKELVLCIRWLKYWSFSFSISPSSEYSGLISFRSDWLFRSPCSPRDSQESSQPHSSKASVLWCSAFFIVQLSHPYMTTGEKKQNIDLTRQTFVGKVMSLLYNMLLRLVIVFLPRSKCLFNFMAAVILEAPRINFLTVYIISLSICHDFSFLNVEF